MWPATLLLLATAAATGVGQACIKAQDSEHLEFVTISFGTNNFLERSPLYCDGGRCLLDDLSEGCSGTKLLIKYSPNLPQSTQDIEARFFRPVGTKRAYDGLVFNVGRNDMPGLVDFIAGLRGYIMILQIHEELYDLAEPYIAPGGALLDGIAGVHVLISPDTRRRFGIAQLFLKLAHATEAELLALKHHYPTYEILVDDDIRLKEGAVFSKGVSVCTS